MSNKRPILYNHLIVLLFFSIFYHSSAQEVAILKYDGGGDWYSNPTAVPNLISFCNQNIGTHIPPEPKVVASDDSSIFNYPIVFMTGHGNVLFSEKSKETIRTYLKSGGFLHISDNYGMNPYIQIEIKKLFPNLSLQEIPSNHAIYNMTFSFPNGVPKIHEHDGKPPVGYGLFIENRLVIFYDYESDLSDGWEDEEMHNDPYEVREKALKMGANIIEYAFKN